MCKPLRIKFSIIINYEMENLRQLKTDPGCHLHRLSLLLVKLKVLRSSNTKCHNLYQYSYI